MMNIDRLNELTKKFADRKIAVIGDFFLDKYLEFDPTLAEISLETGKTANQVVNIRHSPGAAGNIVNNLISLGAKNVQAVGFTGDDGEGYDLRQDLTALGCNIDYLYQSKHRHTPVYLKPRNINITGISGENERYDTKNRCPLPEEIEQQLIRILPEVISGVDGIVIADQVDEDGCGVITANVRQTIAELASKYPEVIFWVDSRQRIGSFKHCVLKPNQFEAINAIFPGTNDIDLSIAIEAGHILNKRSGRPVFLTASENGMLIFNNGCCDKVRGVKIDGPIDPTGAGDSATAGAIMTLTSGGNLFESALIANLVGSITVCKIDTTGSATINDLPGRLEMWNS